MPEQDSEAPQGVLHEGASAMHFMRAIQGPIVEEHLRKGGRGLRSKHSDRQP